MDKKVLSIGNATIDVFVMLPQDSTLFDKFSNRINFPLGEKLRIPEYKLLLGGNACNTSVGLSRLGFSSFLLAEVGSDEFSDKIVNTLNSEGVNISLLKRDRRITPYFNIILSFSGERTIIEEEGELEGLSLPENFDFDLIYLTSVKKDWQKIYADTLASLPDRALLALNPGTAQLEEGLNPEILKRTDVLFVNMLEGQKLLNNEITDIGEMLKELKALGPKAVVITDATNGSYSIDKEGKIYQLSVVSDEKPLERTGAGDSYSSGFLYAMLMEQSVPMCMKYGALNAESVIRKIGGHTGLLSKEDMEQKANELTDFKATQI